MRELLYRAISMARGEHWLYGQPRHYARNPHTEKWTIYDPNTGIETNIDEETLGQYTGLTDIFDKKIFVGDIVKYKTDGLKLSYEYVGIVEWDRVNPSMCIRYQRNPYSEDIEYDFVKCGLSSIEVIGNIWDNKLEDFK